MTRSLSPLTLTLLLIACTPTVPVQDSKNASQSSPSNVQVEVVSSETSQEQSSSPQVSGPQYTFLGGPVAVKNYASSTVYEYVIQAPAEQNVVITSQSFNLTGGRWSEPQLDIFSDALSTNKVDTWSSKDNYGNHGESLTDMTTLQGSLTIPASEKRYLKLTVYIGTPADEAVFRVQHSDLTALKLPIIQ